MGQQSDKRDIIALVGVTGSPHSARRVSNAAGGRKFLER